jgi:hypothetical protein
VQVQRQALQKRRITGNFFLTLSSYAFSASLLGYPDLRLQPLLPIVNAPTNPCNVIFPAASDASSGLGLLDQDYGLFGNSLDDTIFNEAVGPMMDYNTVMPVSQLYAPTYPAMVPAYGAFHPITPALAAAPITIPAPSNMPTGAHANAAQATINTRIPCAANDCTKTFRRPGDMRRHMRKHDPANSKFKCIVDDCDMRFYRLDKLRDHARQGHNITL